jgi:hypothetical protein
MMQMKMVSVETLMNVHILLKVMVIVLMTVLMDKEM